MTRRPLRFLVGAAVVAGLAGCSSGGPTSSATATTSGGCPLTVSDAWVKAADSGMTAAFAQVKNTSDREVTIKGATSPASSELQLHEVVMGTDGSSTMQPKQGGFDIPAGGSLTLQPGGDHIMFMDLARAIEPGDDVTVTLATSTGASCTFAAAARTYDGARETYRPGAEESATPSPGAPDTTTASQTPMDMSTPMATTRG